MKLIPWEIKAAGYERMKVKLIPREIEAAGYRRMKEELIPWEIMRRGYQYQLKYGEEVFICFIIIMKLIEELLK